MKAFTLSKLCIIVGAFSIALSSIGCIVVSRALWGQLNADDYDRAYRVNAVLIPVCAAAAIVSILLIRGVIKRRLALIAPWLIAAFAIMTFYIYSEIVEILHISEVSRRLDELLYAVGFIAVQTLSMYPMCSLFREIYHEKSEKRKQQQEGLSNYEKNTKFEFGNVPSK